MKLLTNKPFIILLIINIVYFTITIDKHQMIVYTKESIKRVLGEIGFRKYQQNLPIESKNLVIYFNRENSYIISDIEKKGIDSNSFSKDKLIYKPGIYSFGGELYSLNKEGLYYMVYFKENISSNIIIYNKDIYSLLSSISWLIVHGTNDDSKSFKTNYHKIFNHKLSLTCGDISSFVSTLLNRLNIENRVVNFVTMDKKNSYDNGHVLIEVKIDGKYTLFDLDNNQYFMQGEKALSAKDFIGFKSWDSLKLIKLSNDNNVDAQHFSVGSISLHGFIDNVNNHIKKWYKRVMQVPMISEEGVVYMGLSNKKDVGDLLKYYPNAVILSRDEFNKKFYGEQ